MITMYPTAFEAINSETKDLMFLIECQDEFCSTVTIKTPVTPELWTDIAASVLDALKQIHKEET